MKQQGEKINVKTKVMRISNRENDFITGVGSARSRKNFRYSGSILTKTGGIKRK